MASLVLQVFVAFTTSGNIFGETELIKTKTKEKGIGLFDTTDIYLTTFFIFVLSFLLRHFHCFLIFHLFVPPFFFAVLSLLGLIHTRYFPTQ